MEHRSYEKDGRKNYVSEVVVRTGSGDVTLLAKAEYPAQQPRQRAATVAQSREADAALQSLP